MNSRFSKVDQSEMESARQLVKQFVEQATSRAESSSNLSRQVAEGSASRKVGIPLRRRPGPKSKMYVEIKVRQRIGEKKSISLSAPVAPKAASASPPPITASAGPSVTPAARHVSFELPASPITAGSRESFVVEQSSISVVQSQNKGKGKEVTTSSKSINTCVTFLISFQINHHRSQLRRISDTKNR